jgi:hypothetical protein
MTGLAPAAPAASEAMAVMVAPKSGKVITVLVMRARSRRAGEARMIFLIPEKTRLLDCSRSFAAQIASESRPP